MSKGMDTVESGASASSHGAEAAPREEGSVRGTAWRTVAAAAGVSAVVAAVISGGTALVAGAWGKTKIAVVDLAGIVELEQLRMSAVVMKKDSTDAERMQVMERLQTFGKDLEQAMETVRSDCGCVMLTSNAVVGSGVTDLTEAVKTKMGLQGLNLEAMRNLAKDRAARSVGVTTGDLLPHKQAGARE